MIAITAEAVLRPSVSVDLDGVEKTAMNVFARMTALDMASASTSSASVMLASVVSIVALLSARMIVRHMDRATMVPASARATSVGMTARSWFVSLTARMPGTATMVDVIASPDMKATTVRSALALTDARTTECVRKTSAASVNLDGQVLIAH